MGQHIIQVTASRLKENLRNPQWRWANLYWILDEKGRRVKFSLRPAMLQFVKEMHLRNIILKARQLGFSTFILIFILDSLLFRRNTAAALVAHRDQSVRRLFKDKIAYPYNNLPRVIREQNPILKGGRRVLTCEASRDAQFANGSSVVADVSVRSGTYQYIHISEYGILCNDAPYRALEVKTGSLETAHDDAMIFIESTAKGQSGHFFEMCTDAQARRLDPRPLENMEFAFHFFGWFRNPSYVANAGAVKETEEQKLYFARVEDRMSVTLSPEQRAWYILKKRVEKGSMRSEHPSTPEEAFHAAVQGAYYSEGLSQLQDAGQISTVPHRPGYPVHTVWDLGGTSAVWFWQQCGPSPHIIRYHEAQGWSMGDWGMFLDGLHTEHKYRYGTHFAPFDVKTQEGVKIIIGKAIMEMAEEAGIIFEPLPLERSVVQEGIPRALQLLPNCFFDEVNCSRGLWALRAYHEGVNQSMSTDEAPAYTGRPVHGPESHGCLVAGSMVATPTGEIPIEEIKEGDEVLTPNGTRRVLRAGPVKETPALRRITTNRGRVLCCTHEHKVFVDNTLESADALRYHSAVVTRTLPRRIAWKLRQLCSTGIRIGYRAAITQGASRGERSGCMSPYGNTITAPFRKVGTFITRITTALTTTSPTWIACPCLNISHSMPTAVRGWEVMPIVGNLLRLKKRRNSGTRAIRGVLGIPSTGKKLGLHATGRPRGVSFAINSTSRRTRVGVSIAPADAEHALSCCAATRRSSISARVAACLSRFVLLVTPERIVSNVEMECLPQTVYDLTVETDHCYFANGILVSNSDAFRYLSMALPLLSNGPSEYYSSTGENGGLPPTSCMVG